MPSGLLSLLLHESRRLKACTGGGTRKPHRLSAESSLLLFQSTSLLLNLTLLS